MSLPPRVNIGRHLDKLPSEDLFGLAEQIEGLISDPAWTRLQEIVAEGRENLREQLDRGPIREQAEYARMHGFIDGITIPAEIAREIREAAAARREKLEREADEDAEDRDRRAESVA